MLMTPCIVSSFLTTDSSTVSGRILSIHAHTPPSPCPPRLLRSCLVTAYLRITHEFTPAGTVETWPAYDTRHNFQTLHKEQKEIMLVFITIGVVAYMIVRIYELCASKRSKGHKKYGWTRMRNYLDFIRPLLFFFAIGHWVNQNYYGYFSMGVPDAGDEVNHIRYCSKYRALETDIQKVEVRLHQRPGWLAG